MTKFFYFIGDCFEALFKILPPIGGFLNVVFILLATFFTIYWIRHMYKVSERRFDTDKHDTHIH